MFLIGMPKRSPARVHTPKALYSTKNLNVSNFIYHEYSLFCNRIKGKNVKVYYALERPVGVNIL